MQHLKVGGYISKLGYDKDNPDIQLPIENIGSDSTYITDYSSFYNGWSTLNVGQPSNVNDTNTNSLGGLFYYDVLATYDGGYGGDYVGFRVMYKP